MQPPSLKHVHVLYIPYPLFLQSALPLNSTTLLWFQLISPFPSSIHFLKPLSMFPEIISSLPTLFFSQLFKNTYWAPTTYPVLGIQQWIKLKVSCPALMKRETDNNNKKTQTYNVRGWFVLWGKNRVRAERWGGCLPEPWSSSPPLSMRPVLCLVSFPWARGPGKASRQKAWTTLGVFPFRKALAGCPMSDIDLYALFSFLIVYGGRASLGPVTPSWSKVEVLWFKF